MRNRSRKADPGLREPFGTAAFVDVETTGLDPSYHEILELGIILFAFDPRTGEIIRILDEYVGLREPRFRRIPLRATEIHGITHAMVKGKRLDDARVLGLLRRSEFVVAHHAQFDYNFVTRLYPDAAHKPWLCSMRQIDWKRHGFPSRKLQVLLASHGIQIGTAHRAGEDCRGAVALLNRRSRAGNTYLQELLSSLPAPVVESI